MAQAEGLDEDKRSLSDNPFLAGKGCPSPSEAGIGLDAPGAAPLAYGLLAGPDARIRRPEAGLRRVARPAEIAATPLP